jgi:hypothetical protein
MFIYLFINLKMDNLLSFKKKYHEYGVCTFLTNVYLGGNTHTRWDYLHKKKLQNYQINTQ